MKELAEALPWVVFWLVVGLFIWVSHLQYMAGHDTLLFEHQSDEEKRLREAVLLKAEREAAGK